MAVFSWMNMQPFIYPSTLRGMWVLARPAVVDDVVVKVLLCILVGTDPEWGCWVKGHTRGQL